MSLQVTRVVDARALKTFIRLPAMLPDRRANMVLPLWSDEEAFHDAKRNPAVAQCQVVRYFAYRSGVVVGRIMGLVH